MMLSPASVRAWLHRLSPLWPILSRFVWRLAFLAVLGLVVSILDGVGISFVILLLVIVVGGAPQLGGGVVGGMLDGILGMTDGRAWPIVLVVVGTVVLRVALATTNEIFSSDAKYRIYHSLRLAVFDKYLHIPYADFMTAERGALFHTLEMDTWNVAEAVQCAFRTAANLSPVAVFGILILMTDWHVGVTIGLAGLLALGVLTRIRKPVRALASQAQRQNERLGDRAYAIIVGMRTIRLHGQEAAALGRFRDASHRSLEIFRHLVNISSLAGPPTELLFIGVVGIALGIGVYEGVPAAKLVLIIALLFRLQPYLMRFQSDLARLFSLEHALHTVARVLSQPDLRDDSGSRPFAFENEIRFENVGFTHANAEGATLSDVSLSLPRGKIVAVLGPSGAGKSTIANILLRLLKPTAGVVLVDGVPIREIDRRQWYANVCLTGQDADLVEGTLLENLTMGHPDVTLDDVRWALAVTGSSEFVDALPEGLETRVGDRGVRFSGGQRQRLGLARAIVGRPAVLVLDEATNAIHAAAETEILRNLRDGLPDTAFLVIAHRSEAVDIADRIVRIMDGRVVSDTQQPVSEHTAVGSR